MSENLETKLLAEALNALSENNLAKTSRLFKRFWENTAKKQYSLLESAEDEFEINDMGEDFNEEISSSEDESKECFEEALLIVDELEDKYTGEDSDVINEKLDEIRNSIDEIKLCEDEEECSRLCEDLSLLIEEVKGEYEVAGLMDDEEVSEKFSELEKCVLGEEEDMEDVSDDDSDFNLEDAEVETVEEMDEAVENIPDVEFDESEKVETEDDAEELDTSVDFEENMGDEASEDSDVSAIISSIEDELADLKDLIGEEESDSLEESWSKISDPRKKMTSEEEGVNKKGTMNFGKLPGMSIDKKAKLGITSTDSKGESADKKPRVQSVENKGAKSWKKLEKPANKPASDKSMLGK